MKAGTLLAVLIVVAFLVSSILVLTSTPGGSSKPRVVVLSVDAARFDHITALAKQGVLPNIAKIMENGVYAELVTVYPSATAVAHAAISTGAPPGVNGIVGNSIHLPGTTVTSTVSGFSGFYLLSEPLWIAAEKQGLTAIVVSFPQSTPPAWNVSRSILFNIYDASAAFTSSTLYTTNTSIPRATYISFTDAANWSGVEEVFGTVAKALESTIKIGDTTWYLYLADLNGDGLFDKLAVAPEKNLTKAYTILSEGDWSKPVNTTVVSGGRVYTIAPLFKAIRFNPVTDFRLYRGLTRPFEGPWYNREDVARDVWNKVVVKTGTFTDGDYTGLTYRWFDEETYMETVNYTNTLFMEFTLHLIKNYDWDIVMTYTPIVDNVYHQFLGLTDPSTPYYNPEKHDYYWNLIVRAYLMVDEFVGKLLESLPEDAVLVLVSDHGQAPVKKIVYVNGILLNNDYIGVDAGFRVIINQTKAYMVWHGHIFINLEGREQGGIVPIEDYWNVVMNITRLLSSYKDPETGEHVFDIVLTRNESTFIGLGGERCGDIVVAVKPGYTTSTALVRDPATGRAVELAPAVPLTTVTGDHGPILPHYRELRPVFIAYGRGIKGGFLGTGSILQVAPTVARLLNIKPPANATQLPLFTVVEVTETEVYTVTETSTATIRETDTVTTTYTTTTTRTETAIHTTTLVTTRTETVVQTETKTTTQTVTQTERETRTATETATIVETKTVQEVNWAITGVLSAVTLLVGLAIGLVAFKRK